MKRLVYCPFCNHKQKIRTKLDRTTCSNCTKKFLIDPNNKVEDNPKPNPKPIYSIDNNNNTQDIVQENSEEDIDLF